MADKNAGLVPMIGPDGSTAYVPPEQVQTTVGQGGVVAVPMRGPDGTHAFVPLNQVHEMMANGAKLPGNADDEPGIMGNVWNNIKDMVHHPWETTKGAMKGAVKSVQDFLPQNDTLPPLTQEQIGKLPNWMQGSFKNDGTAKWKLPQSITDAARDLLEPSNETQRSAAATTEQGLIAGAGVEGTLALAKNSETLMGAVKASMNMANRTKNTILPSGSGAATVLGKTVQGVGKGMEAAGSVLDNDAAGVVSAKAPYAGRILSRTGAKIGKWGENLAQQTPPPEVTSQSRTIGGQPEIIQPAGTPPAAPIPPREGLALPAAPQGAELSALPATGAKPVAQTGEALATAPTGTALQGPPDNVKTPVRLVRNATTGRMQRADTQLLQQAEALQQPLKQAIDEYVPPNGATKAQNTRITNEVNFYLKKGDIDSVKKTVAGIPDFDAKFQQILAETTREHQLEGITPEVENTVKPTEDLTDVITKSLQRLQKK